MSDPKDYFGQELKIGDLVAGSSGITTTLEEMRIKKFGSKMATMECGARRYYDSFIKVPAEIQMLRMVT